MGQKIYKNLLLQEIQEKIETCKLYQKQNPDASAQERVNLLDKNPCNDGTYYAVMTLKESTNVELNEKSEFPVTKKDIIIIGDEKEEKLFQGGCTIEYDLVKNIVKVESYENLNDIFSKLINNYFTEDEKTKAKILRFNPSKSSIFGSSDKFPSLKNDYETYKDSYGKLYYAIGRFRTIKKYIEEKENPDPKNKKVNIKFNKRNYPLNLVSYVNNERLTSLEKKVNAELDEEKLNKITNLAEKKTYNASSSSKDLGEVYDLGEFLIQRLAMLEKSDNNVINDLLKNNQNLIKYKDENDKNIKYYNAFKAFGGGTEWEDWDQVQKNYNSFKQLSNDINLYNEMKKNSSYINNIKAEEQTSFLFNKNNEYKDYIKYSYKISNDSKKFEGNEIKNSTVLSYINAHFIDPKRYVLYTEEIKNVVFNKEKTITISIPVDVNEKNIEFKNKTGEPVHFLYNKDLSFEIVNYNLSSKNYELYERKSIDINGNYYELTKEEKKREISYINEVTKELGSIKQNSFYHDGLKSYFEGKDLIKKLTEIKIEYNTIPIGPIQGQRKTYLVSSSQWKKTCEDALEEEKKKDNIKNNILRAVIDTIPYDPWEKLINKLDSLYHAFLKIQENKDGYIEIPPEESKLLKAINTKCKKCGKTKDQCLCEEVKLCNKIFPLDLFGVTGLLGIDSLLSKFGAFNAIGYIVDENYNSMTYEQVGKRFDFGELAIGADFNLIKDDYVGKQFSESSFREFVNEYNELKLKKEELKKEVKRKYKIGIADGYIYIPTGRTVEFYYELQSNKLSIVGVESSLSDEILLAINNLMLNNTAKYIEEAESLLNSKKLDGRINAKKILVYPYKPDLLSLIGKQIDDAQKEIEEFDFSYFYIPDPNSIKRLIQSMATGERVYVLFDVYLKQPIICGYPKNKNPKCQEQTSNGRCGLEELMSSPIIIDNRNFDWKKEWALFKSKVIQKAIRKQSFDLMKNLKRLFDFSWNIDEAIDSISNAKDKALDTLYSFGKEFTPILNMFPLKCLVDAANDGRNAICSASRQAQDKSVIEDFSDNVNHKLKTTEILIKDTSNSIKEKINSVAEQFQNGVGPIVDSIKNLINSASLYNLCPERFGDYIDGSGITKSFQDGFNGLMNLNILNILKNILGSCLFEGLIEDALGGLNSIAEDKKREVKNILMGGDINSIETITKEYPELLEKFGNVNGTGIDFSKIVNGSSINTNFFQSFQNEMIKRFSPETLMTGVTDKFTDPNVLIDFAKNGAKSIIKGESMNFTSMIMNNIKGMALDQVENQTKLNLSSFGKGQSKDSINKDIIASMNDFIYEKNEIYKKLNKEGKSAPNIED